jgi:hypothetical protein
MGPEMFGQPFSHRQSATPGLPGNRHRPNPRRSFRTVQYFAVVFQLAVDEAETSL